MPHPLFTVIASPSLNLKRYLIGNFRIPYVIRGRPMIRLYRRIAIR